MARRPKLWRRVCDSCGMLDASFATVAYEDEGEASLADPHWKCRHCGSTDFIAGRPLEDADLERAANAETARPELRVIPGHASNQDL